MTDNGPSLDLGRQAAERAAAALRHGSGNASPNSAPGEVFVLPETADYPVQWILLARDPAHPEKRLAVVADANQLVGTSDLEVGDEALGPLVIRRPFGGWIDGARFSPELRVGTLRLDRLARARDHWFGEGSQSSVMAQEVDEDPEYQHWRSSILQPAFETLFEADMVPVPEPRPRWPILAAAAALLLVVGGGAMWFHQQRVQDVLLEKALAEKRLEGEIQDLQAAQTESAERYQTELDEKERLLADYEAKLAEAGDDPGLRSILRDLRTQVQDAWSSVAVVNPALAIVGSTTTRGIVEIDLPPDATHLVLLLKIDDYSRAAEDASYRLELSQAASSDLLWSIDGLKVYSLSEIKVGVPAKLLERGRSYDVRLVPEGQPDAEGETYQIRVR